MALTWTIGDVTVTRILELEATGGTRFILPQADREAVGRIRWLAPHFADPEGRLKMSIHALVIQTPTRRIIVDTCLGNDKERAIPGWNRLQTRFLQDLAAAGFPADSIDTVLCTHLHVDHVGWNTRLVDGKWVPTFPNARYLLGRDEFTYWRGRADHQPVDEAEASHYTENTQVFNDSVRPVFEAGLVDLVATDHRICDEVSLMPTLGHTPGHISVVIESRGQRALITGDFVHHPCQMARPEWAATVDYDPQMSTATRRRVFTELAASKTLVIGTHFATPCAGHVVHDDGAFRLQV